ncbi:MAG: histidine kinase [Bacteroidetes bacterium]|nr:histidine kinase [Bacteroidota bacterium]
MTRQWFLALVVAAGPCSAQYPFTKAMEVRVGQQRAEITMIAQDRDGLIWAASDHGLLRLDGDRVEVMVATGEADITALGPSGQGMVVALGSGEVLQCMGSRIDTLFSDSMLVHFPARAIAADTGGTIYLGTYGAGILALRYPQAWYISTEQGLPDGHVNDLCMLPDGRLAAATDQGVAVCADRHVLEVFGEEQQAPDNLVLSLAPAPSGGVWAGTDNGGAFLWIPGHQDLDDSIPPQSGIAAVRDIAVQGGQIWTAGTYSGAAYYENGTPWQGYPFPAFQFPGALPATDLLVDRDGAVWWCDGTGYLYRADPAVLIIPALGEGIDLAGASALCVAQERIWAATDQGIFSRPLDRLRGKAEVHGPMEVDHSTPVVSLDVAPDGTLWAASFGGGLFALHADGHTDHFDATHGGIDPNVLSVRVRGKTAWIATLSGLCQVHEGHGQCHYPAGSGFMFMALPMADGSVIGATDGGGLVLFDGQRVSPIGHGRHRTFYSLAIDSTGTVWAAGPESGLCRVDGGSLTCFGSGLPAFQGDLYAISVIGHMVLVFSDAGAMAFDATTGLWHDFTAQAGLAGLEAELNAVAKGPGQTVWLASNKGLVRLRASAQWFAPTLKAVITDMAVGNVQVPLGPSMTTSYDRNAVTFRFTAPYYVDPGAVRFEVRLKGLSEKVVRSREREVSYPELLPGRYSFQVRAFLGEDPGHATWTSMDITVLPPWWRLWWVQAMAVAALAMVVFLLLRAREKRIRFRQQLEQDQVRFQLEALRSQVDPHFLFNSFNTLVELIEAEPDKAVGQVEELSTFFRNILQVRDKSLISLEEELRLVDTYFRLEKRRFADAVAMEVAVRKEDLHLLVVPLTLQLLVENAIKHNTALPDKPLMISIFTSGTLLTVANDQRPRTSPVRSTGFGLESIRKRYAVLASTPVAVQRTEASFMVQIPLIAP